MKFGIYFAVMCSWLAFWSGIIIAFTTKPLPIRTVPENVGVDTILYMILMLVATAIIAFAAGQESK